LPHIAQIVMTVGWSLFPMTSLTYWTAALAVHQSGLTISMLGMSARASAQLANYRSSIS